jgi:V/A-type H+-transporting ATPase subunit D
MLNENQPATRSALLALQQEHAVVKEAYDFLDEKRLLLAGELLRQLRYYDDFSQHMAQLRLQAREAMARAVNRHGLDGLQVYPAESLDKAELLQTRRSFMGVPLNTTELRLHDTDSATTRIAANPSPEARQCRQLFQQLLQQAAVLAGISGNIHRLMAEYRKTERRARALENIILPDIEKQLRTMSTHLEEQDMEDIIRVHMEYGESRRHRD